MSKRTISVIVTAYNQAGKLANCLESIVAAAVPVGWTLDVVVVDNNSTDHTPEVVDWIRREGHDQVIYLRERRQGKCFALNTGIRAATGDIIAFTDQDCLASPSWFMAMIAQFDNDPKLDAVGGQVVLFNQEDADTTTRTSQETRTLTLADILPKNIPIVGCNFAVRRAVLDRIGLFDTMFGPGTPLPAAEDVDILHRLTATGAKLIYAPELIIHHDHGRSSEADVRQLNKGYVISRGGYYAKFILQGNRHASISAYEEIRPIVGKLVRNPLGESTAVARRHLGALFTGMYRYAAGRLLRRGGEERIETQIQPVLDARPDSP